PTQREPCPDPALTGAGRRRRRLVPSTRPAGPLDAAGWSPRRGQLVPSTRPAGFAGAPGGVGTLPAAPGPPGAGAGVSSSVPVFIAGRGYTGQHRPRLLHEAGCPS